MAAKILPLPLTDAAKRRIAAQRFALALAAEVAEVERSQRIHREVVREFRAAQSMRTRRAVL